MVKKYQDSVYISFDIIEKKLQDYLKTSKGKVKHIDELIKSIAKTEGMKKKDDMERLSNMLHVHLNGSEEFIFDQSTGIFEERKIFFYEKQFLVVPTQYERREGILLAGDRFSPFANPELFHDEYTLIHSGEKKKISVIEKKSYLRDLEEVYRFSKGVALIDILSAESEENRLKLRRTRKTSLHGMLYDISVFNMKEIYQSFNDSEEQIAFVITIKDWEQGIFEFDIISRRDDMIHDELKEKWIHDLELSLIDVCGNTGEYAEIEEQLALAFFHAHNHGKQLLNHPIVSLEDYYQGMKEITVLNDSFHSYFSPADDIPQADDSKEDNGCHDYDNDDDEYQNHHHEHFHCCEPEEDSCNEKDEKQEYSEENIVHGIDAKDFSSSTGALSSLDAILSDVKAPCCSIEVKAMLLDTLIQGVSFEQFQKDLLELMNIQFADSAQTAAFTNFLEEEFESYPLNQSKSKNTEENACRSYLIQLDKERIQFLKEKTFESDKKEKLEEYRELLVSTLSFLNINSNFLKDAKSKHQFSKRIEDIEKLRENIFDN